MKERHRGEPREMRFKTKKMGVNQHADTEEILRKKWAGTKVIPSKGQPEEGEIKDSHGVWS